MEYPKTNQEIFDRVWQYYVIEGHPRSVSSSGTCLYRTYDGNRCAVGLFIPDESYREAFDNEAYGSGIGPLLDEGVFDFDPELDEFLRANRVLFEELQSIHDRATGRGGFGTLPEELRKFARERGFEIPGEED